MQLNIYSRSQTFILCYKLWDKTMEYHLWKYIFSLKDSNILNKTEKHISFILLLTDNHKLSNIYLLSNNFKDFI